MIAVNDKLPSSPLYQFGSDGMVELTLASWAGEQHVVLFVVPGAFTPTCSARHLPSYVDNAAAIFAKGVEKIGCLAVNDAYVMNAWGKASKTDGTVDMLADPSGATAKALDIATVNVPPLGNTRAARMALIASGGKVNHVFMEKPGAYEVSSAEHILKHL